MHRLLPQLAVTSMAFVAVCLATAGCGSVDILAGDEGHGDPSVKEASGADRGQTPAESSMSDYAVIPLDSLIGPSQLIVSGDVLTLKDQTLTVRPTTALAGEPPSEVEVVEDTPSRFEESARPASYRVANYSSGSSSKTTGS